MYTLYNTRDAAVSSIEDRFSKCSLISYSEMCYHVISSKIVNVRAEIRNGPICSRNITGKKIPTQNILVTELSTNQEMI